MKNFFELDAYQRLPIFIRLHLLFCPRCRSEIVRIQKVLKSLHNTFPFDMPQDISQRIMDEINSTGITFHRHISLWHWILVSFLLLASAMLTVFSEAVLWLKNYFGSVLAVPLHLVIGLVLSAYIVVFVVANLHNVEKMIACQGKWRKLRIGISRS